MAVFRRMTPMLGTMVEVELEGDASEGALAEVAARAFARMAAIQARLSWHDERSELTALNRAARRAAVTVSDDMARVLRAALALSAHTDGLYDVTVAPALFRAGHLPDHGLTASRANWAAIRLDGNAVTFTHDVAIDLGGIAKGYAVDAAYDVITAAAPELRDACVNAGGDLRRKAWTDRQVGLRRPRRWGGTRLVAHRMLGAAVATSAPGRGSPSSRWIDPRTGRRRRGGAASVFAPTCMAADALTKVALAGAATPDLLDRYGARVARPGA